MVFPEKLVTILLGGLDLTTKNNFSLKNWEMSRIYQDTFYYKKSKKFIISVYKLKGCWEIAVCHNKSCNLVYFNNKFTNLNEALYFVETNVYPSFH